MELIGGGGWRSKCKEASRSGEVGMALMWKAALTPIQIFVGLVSFEVWCGIGERAMRASQCTSLTTHSQRMRASHTTVALGAVSPPQ